MSANPQIRSAILMAEQSIGYSITRAKRAACNSRDDEQIMLTLKQQIANAIEAAMMEHGIG